MISKFLNSEQGSIIISIILGFGFASLFRNVCKNGRCIIYKSNSKEIQQNFYKLDGKCYQYKPKIIPCSDENKNKEI